MDPRAGLGALEKIFLSLSTPPPPPTGNLTTICRLSSWQAIHYTDCKWYKNVLYYSIIEMFAMLYNISRNIRMFRTGAIISCRLS
jgi:hypothetical protein